jgi:hypothetical protein
LVPPLTALVVVGSIAACAQAPLPPGSPPTVGRGVSLDLTDVVGVEGCSSPYPLGQLQARLTTADHRVFVTPLQTPNGPTTGGLPSLEPSEIAWNLSFGQFTQDLGYLPPVDLLPVMGSNLIVTAWLARQPNVHAQLVIAPRFDCPQFLNLSGRNGAMGSTASNGQMGQPGPAVQVSVGYVTGPNNSRLVLVRVDDARGMLVRTVLAAEAPPLQICVDGGPGGVGGVSFQAGYPVGPLHVELPQGMGGDGGEGGTAVVSYDRDAPELERRVVVLNRGGPGGMGPYGRGRPGRNGPVPRSNPGDVRELFRDELAHGLPVQVHGAVDRTTNKSI